MKRNLTCSCFFLPSFHEHSFLPELPRAARLLKTSCFEKNNRMCNQDNAHDVDIFPDEKIMKRSEPTNQAQTKLNIATSLKTLNDLKNYLTT